MSFLGGMKERNMQAEKAATLDALVAQDKEATIKGLAFRQGQEESANELANMVAMQRMQELQAPMVAPTQDNQIGLQPPMPAGLAQQAII